MRTFYGGLTPCAFAMLPAEIMERIFGYVVSGRMLINRKKESGIRSEERLKSNTVANVIVAVTREAEQISLQEMRANAYGSVSSALRRRNRREKNFATGSVSARLYELASRALTRPIDPEECCS